MEHLVSILWAFATAIADVGSWAAVVPLAAVAVVIAINWKWTAVVSPRALDRAASSGSARLRTACRRRAEGTDA